MKGEEIRIWKMKKKKKNELRMFYFVFLSGGLLLLATSSGDADMVAKLGETATQSGKNNVAFLSHFLLGDLEKCLDVLIESGRLPEAAFFARTYLPSQISRVLPQWKEQLTKVSEKAGQSLADPNEYKNLFSNFNQTLEAEQMLAKERKRRMPASMYKQVPVRVFLVNTC